MAFKIACLVLALAVACYGHPQGGFGAESSFAGAEGGVRAFGPGSNGGGFFGGPGWNGGYDSIGGPGANNHHGFGGPGWNGGEYDPRENQGQWNKQGHKRQDFY